MEKVVQYHEAEIALYGGRSIVLGQEKGHWYAIRANLKGETIGKGKILS